MLGKNIWPDSTGIGVQKLLSMVALVCGLTVLSGQCAADAIQEITIDEMNELVSGQLVLVDEESGQPVTGKVQGSQHSGAIRFEIDLVEGKPHGVSLLSSQDGTKFRETNWVDGKRHGKETVWNEGGMKAQETTWVEGNIHGVATKWWDDGQKWNEVHWVHGTQHGPSLSWYEDGQKHVEESYVNGQRHGSSLTWHENGRRSLERNYAGGEVHGLSRSWSATGELLTRYCFIAGVQLNEDGTLWPADETCPPE